MIVPLEMWGGVECSIVRVGDAIRNQLDDTGHTWRIDDIKLMAALGLKTVRYPALWELVEHQEGKFDWSWLDRRFEAIRAHGISPIAGLIHHGSGPPWTNFADPEMPRKFAHYAGLLAARFPWVGIFNPVNEPLTSARLSALYGHWHPHQQDEALCFRMLVAECRCVSHAMKAIRKVTPLAKLVQTEDFGRIFSTRELSTQARYENRRRWLALDLLTGRVGRKHQFYNRLIASDVSPSHLAELETEPCVPDVVGVDYYLTSDRMLDGRLALHPGEAVGGNGRQRYVDVAAARSIPRTKISLEERLSEVWNRYGLPIAVTELHNGCTRDESLRWLMEGWKAALKARARGMDILAVSAWSLFGAMDWDTMMNVRQNSYECGAFDARYNPPRPTIIAAAISALVERGDFDHPVLDQSGWWRSDRRRKGATHLALLGTDQTSVAIGERCNKRRLPILMLANESEKPTDTKIWATIKVIDRTPISDGRGHYPTGFLCTYADGAIFVLRLPAKPQWDCFIDTFLDLIIDYETGELRCVKPPHSLAANAIVEPVAIQCSFENKQVAA